MVNRAIRNFNNLSDGQNQSGKKLCRFRQATPLNNTALEKLKRFKKL